MKRFLSILALITISTTVFAQKPEVEATCYTKYAKVFEKRGAFEVEDGTYDDVIITIRKGSMADCFYGKATVKNEKIVTSSLALKFEDDTFEPLEFKFKHEDENRVIEIVNGISNTMFTIEEELINVLFVKKIKPKKKKYAKVADPDFDL